MAVDQRTVLQVLFEALGLGPAPERPAESEVFEVDDAQCTVARAPSGTQVLLSVSIGTLARDPHAAADRLRRLLRISLGLAVVNRASLVCDDPPDEAGLRALQSGSGGEPLRFKAVALISSARRADILSALQDTLQLRTLTLPYLTPETTAGSALSEALALRPDQGRTTRGDDDGSFLIFTP